MTNKHGDFIWYELLTADAEGAKAFYEAVIGWNMTTGHEADDNYGFITRADGGMTGGVMRLNDEMANHGARPCWLGYIGVDNCDATVAAVESAGGKTLMPARDIDMAGRIALVADNGGVPFYVMTPAPRSEGQVSTSFSPMPNPGACGWNELSSADPSAAKDFYGKLFGWVKEGGMDMGPMGEYEFLKVGDGRHTLGALMPKMPETPVPAWTYYFWVDGVDRAAAAVTANGGQIVNGPSEVPGPLWIVNGIDPQGAAFALVGPQK